MARASAALRGTIRPAGGSSPVSASGPARGASGHRRHCRVGPAEQFRRTGGRVMAFSGDSEAMDKQPGQRQCDGQQQPGPQPGRQKNPHAQRPFFFPRPEPAARPPGADLRDFLLQLSYAVAGAGAGSRSATVPGMYLDPGDAALADSPARTAPDGCACRRPTPPTLASSPEAAPGGCANGCATEFPGSMIRLRGY